MRKPWGAAGLFALAAAASLQWMVLRAAGAHPALPWAALLPGLCIFGAAFLLTWAAEAAEMDLPQGISIGILALIAVLPEYAVDMYFAWKAGKDPAYTAYATANMTGANRLLIGLGWPAVLLAAWLGRGHKTVRLSVENAVELVTLLAATGYAFLIPLKGTLSLVDTAVLVLLFAAYTYRASRAEVGEPELAGPAKTLASMPKAARRTAVCVLLLYSAAAIGMSAEPFAEGILAAGRQWGIEEFILVQWLAPLASEAPEFIVAVIFALQGRPGVGLRALVSSKVNQWTLLVGMLPAAYSLSAGSLAPMMLDARQVEEIFLTAAQSLLGLVLIMNLSFTAVEAMVLLVLFSTQVFFPQASVRYAFAAVYLLMSVAMFAAQAPRRKMFLELARFALHPGASRPAEPED